ncbi:AfsR/SARP family transcriptional regulator [Streptomyces reniochalinae]|uniref:AfsR/SARP family transcriptional regulator n=1 Tax=Streptomyces reniochalinae TaxID=2250578 RepID=UPI001FE8F366|nr:BTAD domain-containing putative transcriptional regulator [Streptomyces reniochalinae]
MRYLILGASEARDDAGRPVPLGGQRLRALLAALALRAHSRAPTSPQALIDDVWADAYPDGLPEDAPAALQALVGRLRRALGRDAVESLTGGYRLRLDPERDEVDLLRFEHLATEGERALEEGDAERAARVLREALALWRGPALADLPDRAAVAARMEALRHAALQRRLAADLALGHAARVLPELRQLAPEHPLDEPLQVLHLRALHESGRTAEALAGYESVRRGIASRLGADPGAELRALHAELLRASTPTDTDTDTDTSFGPVPASVPASVPDEGTSGTGGADGTPRPDAEGDGVHAPGPAAEADGGPASRTPNGAASDAASRGADRSVRTARTGATRTPVSAPEDRTAPAGGPAHPPPPPGREAHPLPPGGEVEPAPTRGARRTPTAGSAKSAAASAKATPGDGRPRPTSEGRTPIPEGRGPARPPGNLRARLTSFVGRETDIATLSADLAASRLVTLTGPGGSGKTRLAEQVAATTGAAEPTPHPDGTWFVELAPLDHPTAVPGAVLSALGRRVTALSTAATEGARALSGQQDAMALLVEHLQHRTPLLVLDNCEHVIHAAATLAETLLAHCPGLTVLATSREPLGVPGESVRPVEPLPPAPAHRLFADRAAAARPGFRPSEDAEAVAEICRRLDGLPLAIELAAARLRSLTPRQIADRLDDRFRLLTSGSRTVLPRQQTLRAVVDWSWDLLDERERTTVRRLSVFAGGCTLSAAEHVCADEAPQDPGPPPGGHIHPDDVLDLLSALVDKSILVAVQPPALTGTGVRYRMLETIHDYARERAAEHPEERDEAEARHTAQILRFATAAEPRIRSAEQLSWLPRVEADLDNIRAALHRSLYQRDHETVVALVRAAGWFWWLRNFRDEGARWVEAALTLLLPTSAADERDGGKRGTEEPHAEKWGAEKRREESRGGEKRREENRGGEKRREDGVLLVRELQLLDYFLLSEHRTQELVQEPHHRSVAEQLVATFREPGPASARFPGMLWPFAGFLLEGGKGVAPLMQELVANCRRYSGPWELAVALLFRAHIRIDTPGGLPHLKEELPEISALAESTGDRWLLSQLCGLRAEIAIQEGRYEHARAECETAMRYAQQLGALTEMPVLLVRIAEIWYRQGDTKQADQLAQRAMEDGDRLGVRDAPTLAAFVRAMTAVEEDDIARARELYRQAEKYASVGSLPAVFEVPLRVLDARITACEGDELVPEALRKINAALHAGLEVSVPETLTGNALLTAGFILLRAGRPALAVQLADAAGATRGDLPASVPELRLDGTIRAYSAGAAADASDDDLDGTSDACSGGAFDDASGGASDDGPEAAGVPLTLAEAAALLDKLCDQLAAGSGAPPPG